MNQLSTRVSVARSFVLVACATSITAVAVAAPVRWSVNGHYYRAVPVGTSISWADANKAAKALGPRWHLVTITSVEEDSFVRGLFADHPALGLLVAFRSSLSF